MEVRQLGGTGMRVSRFCLGAMTFGTPSWGCDEGEARRIIDAFLDAGGNLIDTANAYGGGRSEEIVGAALAGRRDEVVVATKVGNALGPNPTDWGMSRKHIVTALDQSLKRLNTDYIDLYQMHYYDDTTPIEETLGVLADCVHAGKVRAIGCSNYFAWQLAEANVVARSIGAVPFASCQMMYNLVRRDLERDVFPVCQARGVALLTYSPLHSGLLGRPIDIDRGPEPGTRAATNPAVYLGDEERFRKVTSAVVEVAAKAGRTPAEVALGWVLRQEPITSVLIGAQSVDEVQQNLAVADVQIDGTLWSMLDAATAPAPSYPSDFYARQSWLLGATARRKQEVPNP
jgi:aryl-alcohol dehydrogenase-like predicted oxidoreductase